MNARALLIAATFWLFGVFCGVWGINLIGGIYEYRWPSAVNEYRTPGTDLVHMINVEGWQPVPDLPPNWIALRRPRLRFP